MTDLPDANASPVKRRNTVVLVWLVLSQILALLSLSPWLLLARMTTMLFDLGSSTEAELIAGAVWAYPLLPLVCAVLVWVLYARRRNWAAVILTTLPLLVACPMSLFAAVLVYTP